MRSARCAKSEEMRQANGDRSTQYTVKEDSESKQRDRKHML